MSLELDDDPQAAARLRSHYRGRHEVLNAIWWRLHPLEPSPRGQADPATARNELALEVFSRAARPELEAELLRVDELLERDERDLDDAIRLFHIESERMARSSAEARSRAVEADQAAQPEMTDEVDAGVPAPRTGWLIVAGVLLVLSVATTSFALGGRLATSDRSVPLGASVLSETNDPLARFDREQTEDDRPRVKLPFDYLEESTRRLLPGDLVGLSPDYVIFGARTTGGLVCLILAFPDERIGSTCVSEDEMRSDGVRVSSNVYRQSRASLGSQTLVTHTVHWRPDDTFDFSSGSADR